MLTVGAASVRLMGRWPWTFQTHPAAPGLLRVSRQTTERGGQDPLPMGFPWPLLFSARVHLPGLQGCAVPPFSRCLSPPQPCLWGDTRKGPCVQLTGCWPFLHRVHMGFHTWEQTQPMLGLGVQAHALPPSAGAAHISWLVSAPSLLGGK